MRTVKQRGTQGPAHARTYAAVHKPPLITYHGMVPRHGKAATMQRNMENVYPIGCKRLINGEYRVHYYGYWIKIYEPPEDSLSAKKKLIEALTRRLFNHVEHGINIPGARLNEARLAWEAEADPELKRVKGAMLAGALFNRATDIFTKLVELQAAGVEIDSDNGLMRECGNCLQEALELGKTVRHRSGEEGIDEMWGEPFKAFSVPIEAFYDSRYIKIAQTMRDIDLIADELVNTFGGISCFDGIETLVRTYADAARLKTETLRTDTDIFDVWAGFAVAGERLNAFRASINEACALSRIDIEQGQRLITQGSVLLSDITRARVPMPKTTQEFFDNCAAYRAMHAAQTLASGVERIK
jgi:hypothetical protein